MCLDDFKVSSIKTANGGYLILHAVKSYKANTAINIVSLFLIILQGCTALRKIEGSPVLWTCEIQGTQHKMSMKKLRFSSSRQQKLGVRNHSLC